MAVSRDCAWVYTLLPNLNKMEFIYLNSIPVSTSVIRSLSIWKIINERTAISSTLVLPAWVPGNWQVMWIFHTNYLLQYFLLNAHLPLLLFRSSSPWHLVGFHGFLYGLPFIFMSSSINSTFFFLRISKMSLLCDLLTCKLFSRVKSVLEASHLCMYCSVPLSLVHLWNLHHIHWQWWMQTCVPFHRVL